MIRQDKEKVKELYRIFFRAHGQKNPSDINTEEKYNYAMKIGWHNLRLMQQARKWNTAENRFPYQWTKKDYWSNHDI